MGKIGIGSQKNQKCKSDVKRCSSDRCWVLSWGCYNRRAHIFSRTCPVLHAGTPWTPLQISFFLFSQLFLFFSIIRFCTAWMILIFSPVFGFLFSFSFLKPVGWGRRVRNFWKLLFYLPQFFLFFSLNLPQFSQRSKSRFECDFESNRQRISICILKILIQYIDI